MTTTKQSEPYTEQELADSALVESLEIVLLEALGDQEPPVACAALFSTLVRVMNTVNPSANAFDALIELCKEERGK